MIRDFLTPYPFILTLQAKRDMVALAETILTNELPQKPRKCIPVDVCTNYKYRNVSQHMVRLTEKILRGGMYTPADKSIFPVLSRVGV